MSDSTQSLSRSTRSPTSIDLLTCNIKVVPSVPRVFFASDPAAVRTNAKSSLNHLDKVDLNLDPVILTASASPDDTFDTIADDPQTSSEAAKFLSYLQLALHDSKAIKSTEDVTDPGEIDGGIVGFANETLELLGFNEQRTLLRTRIKIPFTVCPCRGEDSGVSTDHTQIVEVQIGLLRRPFSLLLTLLHVDYSISNKNGFTSNSYDSATPTGNTSHSAYSNQDAEVVKLAIAAFQYNSDKRKEKGVPLLPEMTIPCIAISARELRLAFYLIPITKELNEAIVTGTGTTQTTPAATSLKETKVLKCVTESGIVGGRGMKDPDYRKVAFTHLLAFKALSKVHWENIESGL